MPENELARRFLEKAKQDLRVLEKWRGDAEIADEVMCTKDFYRVLLCT